MGSIAAKKKYNPLTHAVDLEVPGLVLEGTEEKAERNKEIELETICPFCGDIGYIYKYCSKKGRFGYYYKCYCCKTTTWSKTGLWIHCAKYWPVYTHLHAMSMWEWAKIRQKLTVAMQGRSI